MLKSLFMVLSLASTCVLGATVNDYQLFPDSIFLTENKELDSIEKSALLITSDFIEEAGYLKENFKANISCGESTCEINVYPEELDTEQYASWRGCPFKICATLTYSITSNIIIKETHWQ